MYRENGGERKKSEYALIKIIEWGEKKKRV